MGHLKPGVQARQSEELVLPVAFPNVPGLQSVGAEDPGGQNPPREQIAPVRPSVGVGLVAFTRHTYPALQFPLGAMSAGAAQYIPGEHSVHCDDAESPEAFEKVPTGHATDVPREDPAGHAYPGGHTVGETVSTPQKKAAGHVRQAVALLAFWYVPAPHGSGAALPPTQRLPGGHAVPLVLAPPGQNWPGGQRVVGRTMPDVGHRSAGEHGRQPAADVVPVVLAKVPAGHAAGDADPATQNEPFGQTSPTALGAAPVAV